MRVPSVQFHTKVLLLSIVWVGWIIFAAIPNVDATTTLPGGAGQQVQNNGGAGQQVQNNPGVQGGNANSRVTLQNPLSGINSIPDLLAAILQVFIIIAIPIIIFFIMLAGFKYVTARGNSTQIADASRALLYAIIGGVLILGATAIAQILKNLVNAFR
ncbi:hypothetical protein K2Q16_04555 [Patescibacteria group bacterium]|nr:hypothetical protein [Patescibacteria group bacterium]